MSDRACILRLDRTTANGTVLDSIENVGPDERGMSYIGARVQCPACGSIGHIVANGLRAEDDAMDGKLLALEGDFCRCGCNPPPMLIASQHAGFTPHVSNHLFPFVLRADTSSWGDGQKWQDDQGDVHDYPMANVEAHECGHYFNFPDEYFDQGGWLHEAYIKDEQIDFSLVDAKAETLMWQGRSQKNLMGYGANLPLQNGRATIKPYYLEYVRRQFSLATNKLWRIGYDA
ncbi:PAAR domain-containing protein [Paraburkholderia domus]|uniref:PAAR domain-containing protein n=1 Tax=Paraburkholderia domus TaxID=2793075 RepID=UPI001B0489AA|nr:PAAR domain-containing protein [Paraburkholderia domus]CAE6769123.1 hypothetical protein R69749_01147 [Paraburkholderia domus]CAE6854018.1 hypothetical protein R70199_00483 [Paraburkholderia domus]CAE6864115.1 hypothetical protein R70006_08240 [Paraburkholderia domus]CAE6968713.1 hypothetical protein R75471_07289 [Paraburkholderia domus]